MQGYRVYIFGPDGHVQGRHELRCSNDAGAMKFGRPIRSRSRRRAMAAGSKDRYVQAHVRALRLSAIVTRTRALQIWQPAAMLII